MTQQKIITEQDLNKLTNEIVISHSGDEKERRITSWYNSLPSVGGEAVACISHKAAEGKDIMSKYVDGVEENEPTPVSILAFKNTELSKRIVVLEDLLSSAYNIANRNGENTHWLRFSAQLHINGISPITAKTFKILPSDPEYTHPPDSAARIASLEADKARLVEALKAAQVSVDRLTSDESSIQADFDTEDLIANVLAEMEAK